MSDTFRLYARGQYPWCRSGPCDCDEESLRRERCDYDERYWVCAVCGAPLHVSAEERCTHAQGLGYGIALADFPRQG